MYFRPHLTRLALAGAALLGYGSWAVYSNAMEGSAGQMLVAWRAGAIQGGYSALITLANMMMLEFAYRQFSHSQPRWPAIVSAVGAVSLLQYALIVPVHAYNGTPNILLTLLPGIIIGTVFSLAYLAAFSRDRADPCGDSP